MTNPSETAEQAPEVGQVQLRLGEPVSARLRRLERIVDIDYLRLTDPIPVDGTWDIGTGLLHRRRVDD